MNIYSFSRHCSWDQYEGFVVIAGDLFEAWRIISEIDHAPSELGKLDDYITNCIGVAAPHESKRIVLSAYTAG